MSVCIVVVTREHLPLWAEHHEHAPLGVVGELGALTSVRLGVVLVGADQPHHLAVAIVGVFLPEILFAFPIAPPNMFRYLLLK